jgi:hypothetical protein
MAEVFIEFEQPVIAPDGKVYRAQACGSEAADGTDRWEGWIEFLPVNGGKPVRSRRETTQPNRTDTAYWASGLSAVYLQGTLARTLAPPPVTAAAKVAEAVFNSPAPPDLLPRDPATPTVMDPFSVYRKGETMLRSRLSALSAWHLANIVRANDLSDLDPGSLERTSQPDLVELIVAAVRQRAGD